MDPVKEAKRNLRRSNFIWIIFVVIAWYVFISGIFMEVMMDIINPFLPEMSGAMNFIIEYYATTIFSVITLFFLCWVFVKNRYIWRSFLPARSRKPEGSRGIVTPDDFAVTLYGRDNNKLRMLVIGLLLGFLTNFFCILCALLHGDIKLYFESSMSQLPIMLFAFVATFVQSSSEEMWCRGFMYERLHERYPLWVSIAINGVFFGLLHVFNPSVSVLSIAGIVVCGLSYSILRWYAGNIWIAMGIHTGWNFTQNFLFGLPNSGLVSEVSLFHLDAANGVTNLIYDYGFGVEGALPALFMDSLVGIICLILASRDGRLGELGLSRKQAYENFVAAKAADRAE